MGFVVVRRTWGPDTLPRARRSEPALNAEVIAKGETLREAERLARQHAAELPANGYNREHDYWWGRDEDFRYTFTVEGPRSYGPISLRQA
jgi:hypothetical protein